MQIVNINDIVRVELTEEGIEIHNKDEQEIAQFCKNYEISEYKNYLELPLWELMRIFGSSMHIGASAVFKNNEIYLCKEL